MTEITLRDFMRVDYVESAGNDALICKAARVSTLGSASIDTEESAGLLNFLMKNRHGSPFEHGYICFRIEAPIFVWREFMRHRIGFSYNEQSARYMEMLPVFYAPPINRALVQEGKPGHYTFVPGTDDQYNSVLEEVEAAYQTSWDAYQKMMQDGIAKEVARIVLPVGIYSSCYVSCNPRSLMSFLSLRTKDMSSLFPSFPQDEIERVARIMEATFKQTWPLVHEAWDKNGRVSP